MHICLPKKRCQSPGLRINVNMDNIMFFSDFCCAVQLRVAPGSYGVTYFCLLDKGRCTEGMKITITLIDPCDESIFLTRVCLDRALQMEYYAVICKNNRVFQCVFFILIFCRKLFSRYFCSQILSS